MKKILQISKQLEAKIKRENAKFKRATLAQKRVMIARDVIERLDSGQYRAITGRWFSVVSLFHHAGESPQLQSLLAAGEPCTCCGLGALFLSCTVFNNKTTVEQARSVKNEFLELIKEGGRMPNGLTKIFTKAQFRLIEIAFEGGEGAFSVWSLADEEALKFGKYHRNKTERLRAIMENIVTNKGTFKP